MTRAADGTVKAFENVCLHRQSQIARGCGTARRLVCPYHAWTYDLDGNLVGVPGKEGFPESSIAAVTKLTELPATECAGFLWISLDPTPRWTSRTFLGPLADELDSWGIGRWAPLGEKVLDTADQLEAGDRHLRGELPLRDRAQDHVRDHRPQQLHGVRHRSANITGWCSRSTASSTSTTSPKSSGTRCRTWSSSTRCSPTSCCRRRSPTASCSASTRATLPGRSITVHQNSTPLDLSDESTAAGAQAVFEYAHGTVRDEDYALVEKLQANLASGVQRNTWSSVATSRACSTGTRRGRTRSALLVDEPDDSSRSPGSAASSTSASSQSRYSASDRS